MAINQLIAQGIAPIGRDVPDIINMQQRNALAQQGMDIQQQNALQYQRSLDMQTQSRDQAMGQQRKAEARDWLGANYERLKSQPELVPQLVQYGKQNGYLDADIPDNAPLEVIAGRLGVQAPQGPGEITTGSQGGFRYLQQGGKIVASQAPDRPQTTAPVRPNWTKVEVADPATGQSKVGFVDTNSPNPESTFRPLGAAPKPASSSNPQSIRKEFDSQQSVQNFKSAFTQYRRATTAPDTRAGDISVVYALGKIFDPTSVVREGEIALSQNAQPWLQKIVGEANSQVKRSGRLDPATRSEIVAAMRGQIDSMGEMYAMDRERFSGYAQDAGFDPNSVVGPNLYTPQTAPAAPAAPKPGQTTTHSSGAKVTILPD